jgi:acyl-CoA synthetase (AMP-forming)/AMP-acid ligase II
MHLQNPLTSAEAGDDLTGAGAPFEITRVEVRGVPMKVFARATGTIASLFEAMASHADNDFVVEGDRRVTYAEMRALAGAMATQMHQDFGIRAGDRVSIAMRNSAEWMQAFIAASSLGAIPALINSRGTGDEMRFCIEDIDSALVVADERRAKLLREAGFTGIIVESDSQGFRSALHGNSDALVPVRMEDPDAPACILFTSGTTGRPKGTILTHRAVLTSLLMSQHVAAEYLHRLMRDHKLEAGGGTTQYPQYTSLLVVPLFHVSGLHAIFLSTLARGGKIVIIPRWDAGEALRLVEAEQINAFSGPPTALRDLIHNQERERRDMSSLQSLGFGGQATPPNLLKAVKAAFPRAIVGGGYGMTETCGAISMAMGAEYSVRPEASGRVHPLAEIRIVNDAGEDQAIGETGEIWVRGPMVMAGYWGQPASGGKALDAEGWLRTGDIGSIDADSYITIVDRKTDMVISSGENIYCAEVERVLNQHPDIVEAAAIGMPDDRLGERLVALVITQPGCEPSEAQIKVHVGDHIASYKVPSEIVFEQQPLPRNGLGKIDKRALRARELARSRPSGEPA